MLLGLMGTSEMRVGKEDLVGHLKGIEVGVLSTPRLIQLMETAAVLAIENYLLPDQLSLGTEVRVKHLSATPLGMRVTAHALLKGVDGRRLLFLIDAYDDLEKVAEGEHERVLVSKGRFLRKIDEKGKDKKEKAGFDPGT
jgi:fluoroacetyl-CoA thioesterase